MRKRPHVRRPRFEALEYRRVLSQYYVAPTGLDTAAGTSAAPWKTLQHAADVVSAGDSVTVRAGTYVGFNQYTSGTAAAPIVWKADPGVVINKRNARTNDGINLEGASYVTIDGFKVTGVGRAGIRVVANDHAIVRNNVTDANGVWGIFTGFAEDVLIENNVASRSGSQHGIYVSNSADNPTIRNNTVFGNKGSGIQINADVYSGGDGIITNALVENNVIYNNGAGGGAALNMDGVQNSTFRNNILYDNRAAGIALFQIDGAEGSKNNLVVNNTIVNAAGSRWAVNINTGSSGNVLLNNVIYNNSASRGSISISPDSLPGFVSDYNSLMDRLSPDDESSVLTLAQWQARTGQDQHSFVATPGDLFVDAAGGDYHLKPGSPAIDAGTSQQAPASDFEGTARPQGAAWDIGADETSGATPPPSQAVNFNNTPILTYAGADQDLTGSVAIEDSGATLHITGNRWKKIAFPYTVTAQTVLEFDFKSPASGDVHGIGFDTDNSMTTNPTNLFMLHGWQTWGNTAHRDYAATAPNWKHYVIPVGQYYTGAMSFLTFAMDNDVASPAAQSYFRNVVVSEGAGAPPPAISVGDASVTEGNSGTKSLAFTVSLSSAPTSTVTVDYSTSNGSATAGGDYTAASGTLTFTPGGPLSQTVNVTVAGDSEVEPDETVFLTLANPSNATLADSQGAGTIINDDTAVPSGALDFNNFAIQSYAGADQDLTGSVAIEDSGATLHITGNRWKKIAFAYTVTAQTVLEFDFKSPASGDVHGIGFDTDNSMTTNANNLFMLHGWQTWGNTAHRDYTATAPNWKHYVIPVGQYYTGAMSFLTFVMDNDVASPAAESYFSNIKVYES